MVELIFTVHACGHYTTRHVSKMLTKYHTCVSKIDDIKIHVKFMLVHTTRSVHMVYMNSTCVSLVCMNYTRAFWLAPAHVCPQILCVLLAYMLAWHIAT